ncbi:MAG: NAD-dependent protein deacylase [Lachnospiraceae bacterium]|nr:NAD-dependent protein deacylase [Lachnospiraceae bacterium]
MRIFHSEREKHRYYNSLSEEQKYDAFSEILFDSESVVFLGGAGVSTENGIPDFRSKNGLYKKKDRRFSRYKPEYLLSSECLRKKPELFFDYYRKNLDARTVEPNAAHRKLAEMEASGRLRGVITQNIDGLHQKAGSKNVQEIHGTIWKNHCVSCGAEYDVNFIFDSPDPVPRCRVCGKTVRPDVTLYGEFLPQPAYTNAINLIGRADCLIVGGTSLEVGSAAQLVHMFHGSHLVIINKGRTKMEGAADLVFHDSIGKVLERI